MMFMNKKFIILVLIVSFFTIFNFSKIAFADSYTINLLAGWNDVSSPIQEGIDVQTINNACGNYTQVTYWIGTSYASEYNKLQAGKGYLVMVLNDCNLSINGTPYIFQPIDLIAGWSLIGSSSTNLNVNDILGTCNNVSLQTGVSHTPVTTLEVGRSYWILSTVSCTFGKTPVVTCNDSDGGLNYYVLGQTTLSTGANLMDHCPTNSPYTPGKTLLEAYCTNTSPFVVYQQYECPYGCKDGVCLTTPPNVVCGNGVCEYQENYCQQDCGWFLTNTTIPYTFIHEGVNYSVGLVSCGYIGSTQAGAITFTYSTPAISETVQITVGSSRTMSNGAVFKLNSLNCSSTIANLSMISGQTVIGFGQIMVLSPWNLYTDGTLATRLENRVGGQIKVTHWTIDVGSGTVSCDVNPDVTFNPGEQQNVSCTPTSGWIMKYAGQSYSVTLTIYYSYQNVTFSTAGKLNGIYATPISNATCTDSDGGKNYYVKGFTNSTQSPTGAMDSCIDSTNLIEYYCDGVNDVRTTYACPNGCQNGACISPQISYNVTIHASDPSDYYVRDWNIFTYDPTGTYIGNGKWSSGTPLKTSYYTTSGTWYTNLNNGTYYLVIGQTGGASYGTYSGEITVNGVSMQFSNADINHAIKFDVPLKVTTNKCVNHDECAQACDNVNTFHWMGSGSSFRSWSGTCPSRAYGCMTGNCCLGQCPSNGTCVCQQTNRVDIYGDVCPSGQTCGSDCYCHTTNQTCSDSDGGKNYYTKGSTSTCTFNAQGGGCAGADDVCSGNTLTEGYCDGNQGKTIKYYCPYGCKDGVCLYQTQGKCVNHDECSQACDNLGISYHWMGSTYGSNRRSWEGTCPSSVYGCMTGDCCLGQCNQAGNCFCYRTNVVDIYGSVCPEGKTCGDDCYCHSVDTGFDYSIKTDKYSYYIGESVRIIATASGSLVNFSDIIIVTSITDSKGVQHNIQMDPIGVSAGSCAQSATGATCSITNVYQFAGTYNIPADEEIRQYQIISTAISNGKKKNANAYYNVVKSYSDYVDVFISPKEQYASVGENVKYYVTITDKHTIAICSPTVRNTYVPETGQTITTYNESVCTVQIYNYVINVDGLPYHTAFPTLLSLNAGESKSIELEVFPSSAKTAEGIMSAVRGSSATAVTSQRAVVITGKAIAQTTSQIETIPVQDAIFKFYVNVYLKDDKTVSDGDSAILHVNFIDTLKPPAFPEEETVSVSIKEGWNLLNLPGKGTSFDSTTCSLKQKPFAYVYMRDQRRFVSIQEAAIIMGTDNLFEYVSTHSMWVYSFENCEIIVKVSNYATYSGLALDEGWNVMGVTKDMVGETMNSIKGTCSFDKIYRWNSDSQKWEKMSGDDLIDKISKGLVVKTSSACNLKQNTIQAPTTIG